MSQENSSNHRSVSVLFEVVMTVISGFFYISWLASQCSRHSVSDQIWPLFLALIADYFCTAHMIPRGLYMGLTTWTVGMSVHSARSSLFSCLLAYYERSTRWLVFTACVSCSLPSSWEDEGEESCQFVEFVATEETSSTGSLSSPCLTRLQQSSPWVRRQRRPIATAAFPATWSTASDCDSRITRPASWASRMRLRSSHSPSASS